MSALTLALSALAFALFGLSTPEHHRRRLGRAPAVATVSLMRLGAWAALALSFPPAILAQGWVFGPILWVGSVMLGAGLLFLALNLLPAGEPHRKGKIE
ncbi:DUF3325 domain-containing protein [Sphingomonas sp. R647]|uniref:DUF3325 domain-containing protein n=1 Tax=Sphingomonas sp. R647 TaxID=2875233 RepID=UPI001CD53DFF|nr:DUF3325 domain-containing protein [Sphingomonas sp. R647]MCA1200196.1 DUF3325 domain-containing protein [Sphingomonas sp. R647]